MNHSDHVDLLREGVPGPGGVWADLGAGTGAFTLALAELLGRGGTIYAVDKDRSALRQLEQTMRSRFPATTLVSQPADFTRRLDLPSLDGVVMANALHFCRPAEQVTVVKLIHSYLRPGGRLILVEYDADTGNTWVPYPLSYPSWQAVARRNGFTHITRLASKPSRFLGRIYSALSLLDRKIEADHS